jgi:hypothetical protein
MYILKADNVILVKFSAYQTLRKPTILSCTSKWYIVVVICSFPIPRLSV